MNETVASVENVETFGALIAREYDFAETDLQPTWTSNNNDGDDNR